MRESRIRPEQYKCADTVRIEVEQDTPSSINGANYNTYRQSAQNTSRRSELFAGDPSREQGLISSVNTGTIFPSNRNVQQDFGGYLQLKSYSLGIRNSKIVSGGTIVVSFLTMLLQTMFPAMLKAIQTMNGSVMNSATMIAWLRTSSMVIRDAQSGCGEGARSTRIRREAPIDSDDTALVSKMQ